MPITRPKIADHNIETDELIIREMTVEEFEQYKSDVAAAVALENARIDKIAAREQVLAKLGLTEDEAKLLLS